MLRTIAIPGLALAATLFAAQAAADEARKGDGLCPRGVYSIKRGGGETTLTAVVKLPTPGYKVELKVDRDRPNQPVARFVCVKPSGVVPQVVTTYSASLDISGMRVFVHDAKGRKLVQMSAVAAPKCKSNADCRLAGEFCDTTPSCGPKAPGRCVKKPEVCTMQFDPVEGCDGKTYSNACKAVSEGVSVKRRNAP